jgi:type I restriction enzyme S subunit
MLDRGKPSGHPEVPYLRNVNVQWGRIDVSDVLTMEMPPEQQEFFRLRAGDLLVCEGGEIGRCAVWPGGTSFMAYQKALHRIRPSKAVDARFLRYQLEHMHLVGLLARFATGSTIKHLPQQQLRRLPVLVPPLLEQHRIVEALEDHLSRLDAADSLLSGAMQRTKALGAARSTMATTAGSSGSGCKTLKLKELAWDAQYGTSTKCSYEGSGAPVLRIPNIRRGEVDPTDIKYAVDSSQDLSHLFLDRGDLLFVRTNGSRDLIGRAAAVSEPLAAAFASYLIRFRLRNEEVLPEWATLVISSPRWRALLESMAATSAGQYNLSLKSLGDLPIPLPSIDEQCRIVAATKTEVRRDDRLIGVVREAACKGGILRRSLLQQAFMGGLVPQCPNGKSAFALIDQVWRHTAAGGT